MKSLLKSIFSFIKKEIVFCVAALCAAVSAFFVHPSKAYVSYIDWNTLFILFALMGVVGAFRSCGIFNRMGASLCKRFHTERGLCSVMVALCFFSSMLLTNDVALLTFVPFAITLLSHVTDGKTILYTVVLQTLAANCGSMLTPLGNPQNLFLFQQMSAGLTDFVKVTFPYTALSAAFLFFALLKIPSRTILVKAHSSTSKTSQESEDNTDNKTDEKKNVSRKSLLAKEIIFALLFIYCILCVLRLLPKWSAAILVFIMLLVFDRKSLLNIDYMLLLTFCAFFIFTGNIASLEGIKEALTSRVQGHEFLTSVLVSQVISNVPATLLLFPFTQNTSALLAGVNAGGMGTLVASLASLISYKIYSASRQKLSLPSQVKYLGVFTVMNLLSLFTMCILRVLLQLQLQ